MLRTSLNRFAKTTCLANRWKLFCFVGASQKKINVWAKWYYDELYASRKHFSPSALACCFWLWHARLSKSQQLVEKCRDEMNPVPGSGKTLSHYDLTKFHILVWPFTACKIRSWRHLHPQQSLLDFVPLTWQGWKFCSKSGIQWAKHGFHVHGTVGSSFDPRDAKSIWGSN